MKKVFVSMMLAGALLAGSSAYAQTQTDGTTGATTQKECCKEDKGDKKGHKDGKGKKGAALKGNKVQRQQFNPFDGVQLTDDQQQKLQELQKGLGPVMLDREQQAKIPENPNLTPEQKKQLAEEKKAQKLEAKKKYLNGVKETLTPEQYVIFLENVYLYSPQNQGKEGVNPGRKMVKPGDRGPKVKKDAKAQAAENNK